jgi:hypothetical protein
MKKNWFAKGMKPLTHYFSTIKSDDKNEDVQKVPTSSPSSHRPPSHSPAVPKKSIHFSTSTPIPSSTKSTQRTPSLSVVTGSTSVKPLSALQPRLDLQGNKTPLLSSYMTNSKGAVDVIYVESDSEEGDEVKSNGSITPTPDKIHFHKVSNTQAEVISLTSSSDPDDEYSKNTLSFPLTRSLIFLAGQALTSIKCIVKKELGNRFVAFSSKSLNN